MAASNVVGVSWLALGSHRRAVALEPRGEDIVHSTLQYEDEVRAEDSYFESFAGEAEPQMMPLVQLIKQRKKVWSPVMVEDPGYEGLLAMIAEKKNAPKPVKKGKPAPCPTIQPGSNLISITETLRQSIGANG